jgi:hypothetical protein
MIVRMILCFALLVPGGLSAQSLVRQPSDPRLVVAAEAASEPVLTAASPKRGALIGGAVGAAMGLLFLAVVEDGGQFGAREYAAIVIPAALGALVGAALGSGE